MTKPRAIKWLTYFCRHETDAIYEITAITPPHLLRLYVVPVADWTPPKHVADPIYRARLLISDDNQ